MTQSRLVDMFHAALATASLPGFRRSIACALCGAEPLETVLSLKPMPVGGVLAPPADRAAEATCYPLEWGRCPACGQLQLLGVVDRFRVFGRGYDADAASPPRLAHLRAFAADLEQRFSLPAGTLVVDIGCNDGSFLKRFDDAGQRTQGIEPAIDLAGQAMARGLRVHPGFFSPSIADRIEEERGRAGLVTTRMAFAETDNPPAFLEGVATLLRRDGVFAFEVADALDLVTSGAYDRIQHRVLLYHAVKPLLPFLAANDLSLIHVERTRSAGGRLRGYVQRTGGPYAVDDSIAACLAEEEAAGLSDGSALAGFATRVGAAAEALATAVRALRAAGARLAGYGATSAATTLLGESAIDAELIEAIADPSPLKQGLWLSGCSTPIVCPEALLSLRPDVVLVFAWTEADAVAERLAGLRQVGTRLLIPLPEVRLI